MKILSSASKFVFVIIALTVCITFAAGLLPVEHFMALASGAFAFYFSNKGTKEDNYLNK